MDGEYKLFDLQPDDLGGFFTRARDLSLDGVNVTVPYKERALEYTTNISETASIVGAVNTIVFKKDTVFGDNTDVYGFQTDLEELLARTSRDITDNLESVLILGYGGAARAVVVALSNMGCKIVRVTGRSQQKADVFAESLSTSISASGGTLKVRALASNSVNSLNWTLLINAIPLGQIQSTVPEWITNAVNSADENCVGYDLVYSKSDPTVFQDICRKQSLSCTDGKGMLVYQAIRAFELWTEKRVPPRVMQDAFDRRK